MIPEQRRASVQTSEPPGCPSQCLPRDPLAALASLAGRPSACRAFSLRPRGSPGCADRSVSLTLSVLVSPVNGRPPDGPHSDSDREWRVFSSRTHEVCNLPGTRTALDAQRASLHRSLQNGAILLPSGTGWNANVKKKISLYTSPFTYKRLHRSFSLSLDLPIFNLRLFEIIWSVGDHW